MKKRNNLFIIIGFIVGIIGGILIPNIMKELSFLGTIYVNLLKIMIAPILLTSITCAIYNTKKNKTKIISKTILLFIIMFVITFIISSIIVFILKPGNNFLINDQSWDGVVKSISLTEFLKNIVPNNILSPIIDSNILFIIIIAILFGVSASKVKDSEKVMDIVEGLKDITNKILETIMFITPIGVFSLIGTAIANNGAFILGYCLKYILYAYGISLIIIFVVMIGPAWIYGRISPLKYIKEASKVWLVSLSTCSSAATMPWTMKVCKEKLNISDKVTDLVVPLGTTIHMCGGAVSFALLGIFCSQSFGIEITLSTYLVMIFSATIINMGAPGIPGGGIVLGASYLSILGIPLSFMGIYSGIYRILDMIYTTLNVTGDITANIIINKNVTK